MVRGNFNHNDVVLILLMGVLRIDISSILEIDFWNSNSIACVCLSTKMPGNRAFHWPHKLYQPRYIVMDTKKVFNVAKSNEWTQ